MILHLLGASLAVAASTNLFLSVRSGTTDPARRHGSLVAARGGEPA